MIIKSDVLAKLKEVPDPELGVSIVDLGLIYNVSINKKGIVTIEMTLTTMGCPLFELIAESMKEKVKELKGVKDVVIELTFDPPWNADKMSEEAKVKLGFT